MMEGEAFVIRHKSSVSVPKGQNFVSPSIAVNGMVRLRKMSRMARLEISRSLVSSPGFGVRIKMLLWLDSRVSFRRLKVWSALRARRSVMLDRKADMVTSEYNIIKIQCHGFSVLWLR